MKKIVLVISLGFLLVSCGSSFQGFYNNHKADMGTTSFQVPNFMKAVLSNRAQLLVLKQEVNCFL